MTSPQLIEKIANDLLQQGYSINPAALPPLLVEKLHTQALTASAARFVPAGVGRDLARQLDETVRSDEICWINGESEAGREWLEWAGHLQTALNRRLLLGLFSFESHFAHYAPGAFYRRHRDAFLGEANRVLSIVAYLNPQWQPEDGGELLLYLDDEKGTGLRVLPESGTLVLFLSEEFDHEVLPARRDRYSLAGWFRVNSSTAARADPPR